MNVRTVRTLSACLLALAVLLPLAAGPLAAQVEKVDQLHFPPLPAFDIPQPQRVELPNGMVLLLLEDHELPLVDAHALIHTGSRLEPADKLGLAELTGDVLRTGGTTSMTGDELDDFLEDKAASIETSIGTNAGVASMSCLTKDLATILPVFADVLRHPVFEQDKIDVAKTAMVAGISRQNDNPMQVMFREIGDIIYGPDSPYARDETYATVANVTRDDMVAWHEKYFHPNRIVLGISGDFQTEELLQLIRTSFGDWKQGPAPGAIDVAYDKTVEPGRYYAGKEDMTQSDIAMGYLGIRKDDPDFYAIEVMNQVLSGGLSSRMFSNIRSKKGLAYSVRGSVGSAWDHPGMTLLWMSTKTGTTGAGVQAMLDEARNMTTQPPTDAEVQKAKDSILNSFVFNFDSPRKVLNRQVLYEYYGYPLDRLARYRTGIEAVTTDEVRQAAKKYLRPNDFAILVVGPQAARDQLAALGTVEDLDISIPEPETAKVEASAEGSSQAHELLAKAVESVGGADRLKSLHTLRTVSNATQKTPQGEMQVQADTVYVFPDRFHQELTLPFGKVTMTVSGDSGFMTTPQGVRQLPASQRSTVLQSLSRNPLALLKASQKPGFEATATGAAEVDGTAVQEVQVDTGDQVTTLAIDPQTGHILRIRYHGALPGGPPGEIAQTYSDFRDVDGLAYPFTVQGTFNGQPTLTAKVDKVEINPEIDPSMFNPPPSDGPSNP